MKIAGDPFWDTVGDSFSLAPREHRTQAQAISDVEKMRRAREHVANRPKWKRQLSYHKARATERKNRERI